MVRKSDRAPVPPDPRLRQIAARITEIAAREGISFRELSRRGGLSEAHAKNAVDALESGKTIRLDTLLLIADGGKVSPGWLIGGEGGAPKLRDLPNYAQFEANARAKYTTIPDFAIDIVGSFSMDVVPDNFDASTIRDLANAWFDAASDDLKAKTEAAFVDRRRTKKSPPSK